MQVDCTPYSVQNQVITAQYLEERTRVLRYSQRLTRGPLISLRRTPFSPLVAWLLFLFFFVALLFSRALNCIPLRARLCVLYPFEPLVAHACCAGLLVRSCISAFTQSHLVRQPSSPPAAARFAPTTDTTVLPPPLRSPRSPTPRALTRLECGLQWHTKTLGLLCGAVWWCALLHLLGR